MSRALTSIVLIFLLLGGGLGLARWIEISAPRPPQVEVHTPGPVPVRWVYAAERTVPLKVQAQGTLLAARTAQVAPEVGGRLVEVWPGWRTGVEVQAGTLLFRVDPSELEQEEARCVALLAQAEAGLALARQGIDQARASQSAAEEHRLALAREEGRVAQLVEEGHIRASLLDEAIANRSLADQRLVDATSRAENSREQVKAAQAQREERVGLLALARTRLAKTATLAPFDGRLEGRAPAVGGTVPAGVPLCRLHDISTLHLVVHVPTEQIRGMQPGLEATVRLPARPGLVLKGTVGAVGVQADPLTRSIPVEVDVVNGGRGADGASSESIVAGHFAQVEIELGSLSGALAFQRERFVYLDGRPHLYVLALDGEGADIVEARAVELGERAEDLWVVRTGIAVGERVVVAPLRLLSPGARVLPGSEPLRTESSR